MHYKVIKRGESSDSSDSFIVKILPAGLDLQLQEFTKMVDAMLEGPSFSRMILDMEAIEFLDSKGVGFLCMLHMKLQRNDTRFFLCSVSNKVKEVLANTQMDRLFIILETIDAAIMAE